MTELVVLRHGETLWNVAGRQQGHLDSDLSPRGWRQAQLAAQRLADLDFHALYTSDLGRARSTAEIVGQQTGHPVTPDLRLRERNLGIFQGLTVAEVQERYPEDYLRFVSGDPDYVIPEGESAAQRHARTVEVVQEIAARHPDQRVVIVSHGGPLSSLFRHTLGIDLAAPRRFSLFNASLNTFFVEDGVWTLGMWGDVSHLQSIGSDDDR